MEWNLTIRCLEPSRPLNPESSSEVLKGDAIEPFPASKRTSNYKNIYHTDNWESFLHPTLRKKGLFLDNFYRVSSIRDRKLFDWLIFDNLNPQLRVKIDKRSTYRTQCRPKLRCPFCSRLLFRSELQLLRSLLSIFHISLMKASMMERCRSHDSAQLWDPVWETIFFLMFNLTVQFTYHFFSNFPTSMNLGFKKVDSILNLWQKIVFLTLSKKRTWIFDWESGMFWKWAMSCCVTFNWTSRIQLFLREIFWTKLCYYLWNEELVEISNLRRICSQKHSYWLNF